MICGSARTGRSNRKIYKEVKKTFEDAGCRLLTKEYKNNTQELQYICSCGNHAKTNYANARYSIKCRQCISGELSKAKTLDYQEVKQVFEEAGFVLLSKTYTGKNQKLEYICTCGVKATKTYQNIKKGQQCQACGRSKTRGENHYLWNAKLTKEERRSLRAIDGYDEWRKAVYERDNYICQSCEVKRKNLCAHHLNNYLEFQEERIKLENGITLCKKCHNNFHVAYKKKNVIAEDYYKWAARRKSA